MSENNLSYRIRTNVGDNETGDKVVNVQLNQDYDILEILSLKIKTEDVYHLHTSKYGCIAGRVLANDGFGIPNAKISVFIGISDVDLSDPIMSYLYPYGTTSDTNQDKIRYNLLPDEKLSDCHQQIGTFPTKRKVLDDDNMIEVFENYYQYTTRSNAAGDFMIFGVPVGNQTLHVDIDLSDIGALSQKPRDLLYKGYDIKMFENSSMFKSSTNIDTLAQVITQEHTVYVYPFWGEEGEGDSIAISRQDININYKFEPTCVFFGSLVSDDKSNAFSKRCIPTERMGKMDRLVSGNGTIEMIRKTPTGEVEEFQIQGNQLIDGNGTWCYQIPMNLDYVTTDEYGNIVPTDDPEKGIPTRTTVRFRISLNDFESDYINNHLTKILVPTNPKTKEENDENLYVFGTNTPDHEFRDLFWNDVYTVKSYIPRLQKGVGNRNTRFSGFKAINVNGGNNPMPYNNIRVNTTFTFTLQCAIVKMLIYFATFVNWVKGGSGDGCMTVGDGLCPDLEDWYFAPGCNTEKKLKNTYKTLKDKEGVGYRTDKTSIEYENGGNAQYNRVCVTSKIDRLLECIEMNLAAEYDVIQFDFYNDWINGLVYLPRWFANIKKKRSFFFGAIKTKDSTVQSCANFDATKNRRLIVQQCSLTYSKDENGQYTKVTTPIGCVKSGTLQRCHRGYGRGSTRVYDGGFIHKEQSQTTEQFIYYPRAIDWGYNYQRDNISEKITEKRKLLFATDIVLLGNLNENNTEGIPQAYKHLVSSTFQMPTNIAATNMDTQGPMYEISGKGTYCSSNIATTNGAVQLDDTFENYQTWSKKSDDYDANANKNTIEYPITEASGINWNYSGPKQGKKNNSELYQPGGHFLGMACMQAAIAVNIKSCVNLSRICEAGVSISQRKEFPVRTTTDGDFTYVYTKPTGFISKDEITDSDFRTMFATLNHNGLKTIIDSETLYHKYDFKSMIPVNFDGALKEYVINNTNYNKTNGERENGNDLTPAYLFARTYEDSSKDYYRFRLGLTGNTESDTEIRSHYLHDSSNSVSMPVYENSFYFYFGIKDGSTSLDRFFNEYAASCTNVIEDNNNITLDIQVSGCSICNENSGSVYIKATNAVGEFNIFIKDENNNIIYGSNGETITKGNSIKITELSEGTYTIYVGNATTVTIERKFTIATKLPNEVSKFNPSSNNYNSFRKLVVNSDKLYKDDNIVTGINISDGGIINTDISDSDFQNGNVVGFIVYDGEYYAYKGKDNTITRNRIDKFAEKYNGKEITNVIYLLDGEYSVHSWAGNNSYYVDVIYNCDGVLKTVNISTLSISMNEPVDIYIGNSLLTYNNDILPFQNTYAVNSLGYNIMKYHWWRMILFCAHKEVLYGWDGMLSQSKLMTIFGNAGDSSNYGTFLNQMRNLIRLSFDFSDIQEWLLKKAIFYTDSCDTGYGDILVGPVNGTAPYTETLVGNTEIHYFDGSEMLMTVGEEKQSNSLDEKEDLSLTSLIIPTVHTPSFLGFGIPIYLYLLFDEDATARAVILNDEKRNDFKISYKDASNDSVGNLIVPSVYVPWYFKTIYRFDYKTNSKTGKKEAILRDFAYKIYNGITYPEKDGSYIYNAFGDVVVGGYSVKNLTNKKYSYGRSMLDYYEDRGVAALEFDSTLHNCTEQQMDEIRTKMVKNHSFSVTEGSPSIDTDGVDVKTISETLDTHWPTLDEPYASSNIHVVIIRTYTWYNSKTTTDVFSRGDEAYNAYCVNKLCTYPMSCLAGAYGFYGADRNIMQQWNFDGTHKTDNYGDTVHIGRLNDVWDFFSKHTDDTIPDKTNRTSYTSDKKERYGVTEHTVLLIDSTYDKNFKEFFNNLNSRSQSYITSEYLSSYPNNKLAEDVLKNGISKDYTHYLRPLDDDERDSDGFQYCDFIQDAISGRHTNVLQSYCIYKPSDLKEIAKRREEIGMI